jgi:hypothetical protein
MKLVASVLLLLLGVNASGQEDPVQWKNSSRKVGPDTYEIHLTATVQTPWHIYSQTTPEGGPMASVVTFTKSPVVKLVGRTEEKGAVTKKHEEVFGVDVVFFNGSVDFVQKVVSKVNTKVKGSVKYMVCNDKECLAPKTVPFSVQLK